METASREPEPINNTWWRRAITLSVIKCIRRRFPRSGNVLYLSRRLCVKYGYFVHLSEAATMQFIAQRTSIPVPKVYCAFKYKTWTYIVMERIDGEIVGANWYKRTKESKDNILCQLRQMIDEMRRILPAEHQKIASATGGTIYDARLSGGPIRRGPFNDIGQFHLHVREGIEAHPDHFPEIHDLIAAQNETWPICFTHGDLSSLNILVRGEDVVGIVDWETAGWYPSYWEYTSAWHVNPQNEFWQDEVGKFLEPMPKELAMEKLRRRYFGDIT